MTAGGLKPRRFRDSRAKTGRARRWEISCGGGNHSEQVSIDPWEVRERLLVYQSRGPVGGERTASCDPWEVREQLFRGFRASQTYITGSESNVNGSKAEGRACLTLRLRVPKATLDILGAYSKLDCGKLWRRKSLGTGVYQPEDPWEVRERLLVHQPEDPWPEDPWEVRERLLVYQPEDPWEVRERLFRCFRGVSVTAGGLKRC